MTREDGGFGSGEKSLRRLASEARQLLFDPDRAYNVGEGCVRLGRPFIKDTLLPHVLLGFIAGLHVGYTQGIE